MKDSAKVTTSNLQVPEIVLPMLGIKDRMQPKEVTERTIVMETPSKNPTFRLKVPEIVLPMLEINKDPIWPQNPTSKGKKTETSTSKKLVHLIPEIILAKLSITKGLKVGTSTSQSQLVAKVFLDKLEYPLSLKRKFKGYRPCEKFTKQAVKTWTTSQAQLLAKVFLDKLEYPLSLKRKFKRFDDLDAPTSSTKRRKATNYCHRLRSRKRNKRSKKGRYRPYEKFTKQAVKKDVQTKATTTSLVGEIFQSFFPNELNSYTDNEVTKSIKQQPVTQRCTGMSVEEDHDPNMEHETVVKWVGEPVKVSGARNYYSNVLVDNEQVDIGDYVRVCPTDPKVPLYVCKVISMWENNEGEKLFHGRWFSHCWDTVIGYTGDPKELFLIDLCDDNPLGSILGKCVVKYKPLSDNWLSDCTGKCVNKVNDGEYYYRMWYDDEYARFEQQLEYCEKEKEVECISCIRSQRKKQFHSATVGELLTPNDVASTGSLFRSFYLRGVQYEIGDTVYLTPDAFDFRFPLAETKSVAKNLDQKDEDLYPEYYRKKQAGQKMSNPRPFNIGQILSIKKNKTNTEKENVMMECTIRKFYRPENTHLGMGSIDSIDHKLLYYSDEEVVIDVEKVVRKCRVLYKSESQISRDEGTSNSRDMFYFTKLYNSKSLQFEDVREVDVKMLDQTKGADEDSYRLKTMDIYAGCGGFSEGLHQAGIAETLWAIERNQSAAEAFSINHPDVTVFNDDCNIILKQLLEGETETAQGQLPKPGQVELLVGGPPCQGYSFLNRFPNGERSVLQSSQIANFLSFCDFYRPKMLMMENVKNYLSYKDGMVLKLTLRCLLKMGYQCTFGVLQCGSYGIPQSRHRAFVVGAAPGQVLPLFPEPTHCFPSQLPVVVDKKKYVSNVQCTNAPYRSLTVRDAIADLASINERKIQGNVICSTVKDHICRELSPIEEARISRIPHQPGADWRDLPNISVLLSNGKYAAKLIYTHYDKKNGSSVTGAKRGVCSCADGTVCKKSKQCNTLIPWSLVHTANRNCNWAGKYGRLDWDGFFPTTTTYPKPDGYQGRTIHPSQDRVLSIRECARSQGFNDTYCFVGSVAARYRQVGNAVPPPVGKCLGLAIKQAFQ